MSECPFSKDILVNWVTYMYFIHEAIDLGITIMSETAGEYTKTEHMTEYQNMCSKFHAGYKCLHLKGQSKQSSSFSYDSSHVTSTIEFPDHCNHFSTSSHKSQKLNEKN